MDRDQIKKISIGLLIGVIVCLGLYKLTDFGVFIVLCFVMIVGDIVLSFFNKCPHCGHHLGRHHWKIEFCPYCGGYL